MKLFVWISAFLLTCYADENTFSNNQKIRNKLLKDYDTQVRPQKFHNGTTNVYLFMLPRAANVDDTKEQLILNSWLAHSWRDERLIWNKDDYGGIRKALFGDNELWKPDLTVYNNAEISDIDHYGNTHFHVFSSGYVYWIPPARTISHCRIDLTDWPYDTQSCNVSMGSWSSHGWQIQFKLWVNRTEMFMGAYLNVSSHWNVLRAHQKIITYQYSSTSIPYQEMIFEFDMKRISPSFAPVIVVPATMLPILLLVQFILPVDHSKRIVIGCVCAILVLLEMVFIKFTIPRVGTSVPLIVSYYSLAFVIVVFTVALSAFLGRLSHPQNPLLDFPPWQFLKIILTGPLATFLCLQDHASKVSLSNIRDEDGEVLDSGSRSTSYAHEWLLVAKTIDRLAFIFFMVVFAISLIAYTS